mgnify:CR=1 FL=1
MHKARAQHCTCDYSVRVCVCTCVHTHTCAYTHMRMHAHSPMWGEVYKCLKIKTVFPSQGAYNLIEKLRQAAKEFNLVPTAACEKVGINEVQRTSSPGGGH